ncbi:5-hydroxytryptamine receptor 3A-like [Micropterus salmoides]|uniref:5-hydroxytryptamine receptor 3A-like n=1 Tax=Micropterus salmoides TaxID=27706 RepID=UPI0018EAC473|nr:5-hydroxytryptamine receptor 3A-like [Micropterus salmoides]
MIFAVFLFLLLLTGGSTSNYTEPTALHDDQRNFNQSSEERYRNSSAGNCGFQDVLNHLNLTKENHLYFMARPVKHYNTTTVVHLHMLLYSILDVKEIDQTFVPYVWILMAWQNEHIKWDPDDFCGLETISVPIEALWKPDITIEEMVEKDKAPPSPYVYISADGWVERVNDMVLVNTCKMQVYKFPFDIQSCNISFKSALHSDKDIQLKWNASSKDEVWSHGSPTQYEWLFINMIHTENTVSTLGVNQSTIIYTITMKRRSLLYVVNFMLPVLFFLCLDLSSFLISDRGGEKLSFKVTVLLAVTVLQLILNDILPASSNKIPLIATYCIGSFGLMMLSLLETILVMHLIRKDSRDNKEDRHRSLNKKRWTHRVSVSDVFTGETPSGLPLVAKEDNSSKLTESNSLKKVSDDLTEVEKTLTVLLNSRKEEGKPGYWTGVANRINKVFFIFYVTVASLFLACIFITWIYAADE